MMKFLKISEKNLGKNRSKTKLLKTKNRLEDCIPEMEPKMEGSKTVKNI